MCAVPAPEILELVMKNAQEAGCNVERVPCVWGTEYNRCLLKVDGRLHQVHHLTNVRRNKRGTRIYAATVWDRTMLERAGVQVVCLESPEGARSILVVPSEDVLDSLFTNGKSHRTIYIAYDGTPGVVFDLWRYKDVWKLQRKQEQEALVTSVDNVFPKPLQSPAQMLETARLGAAYLARGQHIDD